MVLHVWWWAILAAAILTAESSGERCPPNICGENAECEMRNGKVYCKCPTGYLGSPLHRCRPECEQDGDCLNNEFCDHFRCRRVCGADACVPGATCDAVRHRPVCTCPPGFLGTPETRCYPECTESSHCPNRQACINTRCENPCHNACGQNAECEVRNHTPVCKCPRGMTGHPLDYCRPFTAEDVCKANKCGLYADCTPQRTKDGDLQAVCTCPPGYYGNPLNACKRGECVNDYDCPASMICRSTQCSNPCDDSACGINSKCEVKSHRVYCSCPIGFTGNALIKCYPN